MVWNYSSYGGFCCTCFESRRFRLNFQGGSIVDQLLMHLYRRNLNAGAYVDLCFNLNGHILMKYDSVD